MRHVRMLGLCLLAALAVAAYAVSSASALPEWGKCEAKAGGKYSDANCTVKAKKGTGAYEWLKASEVSAKRKAEGKSGNVPFAGHNEGSGGVLTVNPNDCDWSASSGEPEPPYGIYGKVTRQACAEKGGEWGEFGTDTVECESQSNAGEASGKKGLTNVKVVFRGCALFGIGGPACTGPEAGLAEGEVRTSTLKGELGYINKGTKEVGVLLEPAQKHGKFAEFSCLGGLVVTQVGVGNKKEGSFYVSSGCIGECAGTTPAEEAHGGYDGIISPIIPVNTMTSAFKQVFSVTPNEENTPTKFQGKHIDLLESNIRESERPNGSRWSAASEEITNISEPEEGSEIKA